MYVIRRALTTLIWGAFLFFVLVTFQKKMTIFVPHPSQSETLTTALYLLTTLTQSLSAILAVTIAVLFITAQIIARTQYLRALTDLYKDHTTFTTLLIFFVAIVTGILTLATIADILKTSNYWLLDLNILISLLAVLLLGPLVLAQLENLNPYLLAEKLALCVTTKRIQAYNLAVIARDRSDSTRMTYSLNLWGHKHDRDDPLGSMHELVMEAVRMKDRVELSTMTRILLQRIAYYSGVYYPVSPKRQLPLFLFLGRMVTSTFFKLTPKVPVSSRLAITLHIMHYVIRRAHNLRHEWGNLDVLRQQFVANIGELIDRLISRKETEQTIDLCILAVLHICLGYAEVKHFGGQEPLTDFLALAEKLAAVGKREQALLCIRILAFIRIKSREMLKFNIKELQTSLSPILLSEYDFALKAASRKKKWLPNDQIIDPWQYMVSGYKLLLTK